MRTDVGGGGTARRGSEPSQNSFCSPPVIVSARSLTPCRLWLPQPALWARPHCYALAQAPVRPAVALPCPHS